MLYEGKIWLGTGEHPVCLLPQMANRHGLIAGATGTGKTVSLKVLAEGFSDMGVPVFLADIKGDLAGMVQPGTHSDNIANRLTQCGVPTFEYRTFPTVFWDVFGKEGHPVRTTVSEMGPTLLARLMNLNDTQAGVLSILFRVADDENMLLLDLKDLKVMLAYVGEHAKEYTLDYGNVSMASVGAIQRAVAMLEDEGGNAFFGEPALNIADWMQLDESGRGVINILAADVLYRKPRLYSTFLLWMLSELYELLPECGDLDKPRMVFFFDEAHLLFDDCPKALLETLEQVVRLIRSKGVGVYFVTQNPCDIPMSILGQLGNRVQHALRAYTPLDQKAVRTAAMTFRANPAFDTAEAITTLKTGEALVSFLDADGAPSIVERATILPPQSAMNAIDGDVRQECIESSPFRGVYDTPVDRVSAYEMLASAFQKEQLPAPEAAAPQISTAAPTVSRPDAFLVFDPQTGHYVQREAAQPMAQAAPSTQQAPAAAVPQSQTQADIAKAKLAADNAAKARMKAAQEENARQKAEIEKKAKAAKAARDDQLQAAIAQQQKKEAAAKKASADASQQRWVIPVGAFSDPAAAKKVVANGRANGVSLSTSSVKSGSTTLTRVTAGPFKTRDQAEAAEAKLAMAGIRTGGVHQAK